MRRSSTPGPRFGIWAIILLVALLWSYIGGREAEVNAETDREVLRIASWNIRILSDNSRDDVELQRICEIIIKYDFISIVELRDEKVLVRMVVMLAGMGRLYGYEVSVRVGRGVKERYAYLYDINRVELIGSGKIWDDPEDHFIREPFSATFRAGAFDFTAIATHVIWGRRVGDRRAEIMWLSNVYKVVQAMDRQEQDVLLMGDFNRKSTDLAYDPLKEILGMVSLFNPPQKSHVKDTSLYDNIWFQSGFTTEYTGNSGIDRFDDGFESDDAAMRAVSDHRPVWAEFATVGEDDD